ncbi:hypothetical protein [Phycisphaera mikurensis]|uniref:Uncharacterized protein n=1 Tax=Phycisphaera mikurensis (strain NBRC 102666 / KCTC 22515 / FYK2301M01) TaxID=1142394 RepID=I0IBP3_PHYMF|nr:hypothetical protein [Phycisphaera mikurensis]MBB6443376.1 hypothetical protein [Phycisphaera mikurensis]BAM02681.1 hypothetical protein PSMK_05220 [Phycisphaera mikurensis NBRC 102666]
MSRPRQIPAFVRFVNRADFEAGSNARLVPAADGSGRQTIVLGTAQATGETATHANQVNAIAQQLAESGDWAHISLDRNYRTATGRVFDPKVANPLNGNQMVSPRPDIVAVGRDGRMQVFEVQSEGQNFDQLAEYVRRQEAAAVHD